MCICIQWFLQTLAKDSPAGFCLVTIDQVLRAELVGALDNSGAETDALTETSQWQAGPQRGVQTVDNRPEGYHAGAAIAFFNSKATATCASKEARESVH